MRGAAPPPRGAGGRSTQVSILKALTTVPTQRPRAYRHTEPLKSRRDPPSRDLAISQEVA